MKSLVVALVLFWAVPSWAGTSHAWIPNQAFDCISPDGFGITCSHTYTDVALSQAFHYPILSMPDNTHVPTAQYAPFLFPESHIATDAKFDATVQFLVGGAGTKKYCWIVAGQFVPDETASGNLWGNLFGVAGVATVFSVTTGSGVVAGSKVSATSVGGTAAFVAYNGVAHADCTYAACKNQPGFIVFDREYSGGINCSGGTTDTAYPLGVDISWQTL